MLDRTRPDGFRAVGLVIAGIVAVIFSGRDNLVRFTSPAHALPPLLGASLILLAGLAVATLILALRRPAPLNRLVVGGTLRAFAPAGLLFAGGYVLLMSAYDNGR